MPDMNEKIEKFRQIVLADAAAERTALLTEVSAERTKRLHEAETQIRLETDARVQAKSRAITSEIGRELSRRALQDKRTVATRREEMAREVFAAVRQRIQDFTQTEEYLPHLKKLYVDAFAALGNPFDGVIWLRPEDMKYTKDLAACLPGRHVSFQEGGFTLGGLIVDCHSKLLRADQSYDTALGDLDGHFAELFGLSLADD